MPAQFDNADMALNVTTCILKSLASPHSEVPLGSFTNSFPRESRHRKEITAVLCSSHLGDQLCLSILRAAPKETRLPCSLLNIRPLVGHVGCEEQRCLELSSAPPQFKKGGTRTQRGSQHAFPNITELMLSCEKLTLSLL